MPQAIGLLIAPELGAALTVGGVALTTATGALTFAGIAANLVGSLLLSDLAQALAPHPNAPIPANVQNVIKQAIGPRLVHVGRVRVGGTLVFARQKGGNYYQVVVHGHGQIDGVEHVYLDKVEVTLDGSGNVQEAQYVYSGVHEVQIQSRLGVIPETAYADLTAVYSEWDANHRLDGLWSSFMICRGVPATAFQAVYPNRVPAIEKVARGVAATDPRTGVTAWTENAALLIGRLVEDPDGFNRPGRVNATRLIQAANDCDDAIPLAAGGTEARYRLGGSYGLNEKPKDVLSRMLNACGGRLSLLPDGSFAVDAGVWRAPTVTLTAADIIEMTSWQDGPDLIDRYNELPFTYIDQSLAFQQVSGDPWVNAAQQSDDGETLTAASPIQLDFCPSHAQARRCAKIRQGRDNPAGIYTLRCKPSAMVALYERYIELDASIILASGYFEVMSYALSMTDGSVTYTLHQVDPASFNWSTTEEGVPQALPVPDIATSIPVPLGFVAAPEGLQVAQNSFSAGIGCAWLAPTSPALTPRLEYSSAGAAVWTVVYPDAAATTYEIVPLTDGSSYDVRLAWVSPTGQVGPYATETAVIASAATTPPAAPAALTVSDLGSGNAAISVTSCASANLWKTIVLRDGTIVATFYSAPNIVETFTDACGAGTFNWTARSINVSGIASATDFGPVAQTIT